MLLQTLKLGNSKIEMRLEKKRKIASREKLTIKSKEGIKWSPNGLRLGYGLGLSSPGSATPQSSG